MSAATIPEVQAMPEQATDASEQTLHPRRPKGEPLFNAQQQLAFDKAFTRRERKVRAEYQGVLTDLFETVGIAKELLARCKDRLSVEDQVAILDGLEGIRRDWEKKWLKQR